MDDNALVARTQNGDLAAYGLLVERYRTGIVRLCFRVCGNVPDAEDLAHQAFVEAYLKLGTLREPGKFAGWLRSIALNICRMWYRRRINDPLPLRDDVPAATADDDERSARLGSGLAQLSAAHRLTIALHHGEQMSYEDIAAFLNVPVGTVMSRLHRARQQLKRILDEMMDEEETLPEPDADFTREIEVEIESLLGMFGDDPQAAERLSVLLVHSPERLAALIHNADTLGMQADIAMLLRRLGQTGIDIAVNCALSPNPELSERGEEVLKRFVANGKSRTEFGNGSRLASRGAYRIVNSIRRSSALDMRKAALIAALLWECTDERTTLLLLSALLHYREPGEQILIDEFRAAETAASLARRNGLLPGLCRLGSRFARVLVEMLRSGHERETSLAMAGADALVRSWKSERWAADRTADDRLFLESRYRLTGVPPASPFRDETAFRALTSSLADMALHDDADLRDTAIRLLGIVGDPEYLPLLRVSAQHVAASTRIAAMRALASCGTPEDASIALAAVSSSDPAERRAAAETLGRFKAADAIPRLQEMLRDPDRQVCRAAVTAIGEIGGDTANQLLKDLLKSGDRDLAKAAAAALYGNDAPRRTENYGLDYEFKRSHDGTMGSIIRNGVEPPYYIALDAAMRSLPEMKPYDEGAISRLIGQTCYDYACTRRFLVEEGLTTRDGNTYRFTEMGEIVWQVERSLIPAS